MGDMSHHEAAGTGSRPLETAASGTGRPTRETTTAMVNHMPRAAMMAKGIATGVAVSTITQTGRGIMSTLAKHPLVMFSLGLAAGYFVHKYRKEIIATVTSTAEHGKDFVLRQKENLEDMLAESRESAEESSGSRK